jgi:hypothetical protein
MQRLIDKARGKLDRTYHARQYSEQRKQLQNSLVLDILQEGREAIDANVEGEAIDANVKSFQWMIMTAGPIGAGKST